ncbi:MAG: hypothetical protein M3401_15605 [Actinomycetota bacterium]|nr:hypothetical protein [Actinomycetota bacterium]
MLSRLATLRTRMRLLVGGWVTRGRRTIGKWWRRSEMPGQLWAAWLNLVHVVTRRDRAQRWQRAWIRRFFATVGWALAALLLLLEVAAVFLVAWNLLADKPLKFAVDPMNYVDKRCEETGFACTVASSIFFTVVPLLVGSFVFVFWRMRRVQRPLVKRAKEQPTELVETAGEIVGSVVGRDDVCNVLLDNLRESNGRLPYVIVGGVGVGKTAVLVRLTQLLGRRGAIPVPIRLRDADKDLDFLEMAREAFLRETQSSSWLSAEAERAWGRLCKTDKIVVLADGLEEVLADSADVDQERDHFVRAAVRQARRRGYPLVIASREHDALSALDAALLRLEPVNEDAALDYVEEQRGAQDESRLGWIIDRAHVVETPLYLQMVRELHEGGQLRHTTVDTRGTRQETLETRGADHVLLRVNLAESWVNALIAGNLEKEAARVPLNAREREATVLQLAALACCGLANDTLQVTFNMFETPESDGPAGSTKPVYPTLQEGLKTRLREALDKRTTGGVADVSTEKKKYLRVDMQVAASNGVRLGLIEPRREGVRFPHSTMQAYLGSIFVGEALKDEAFRKQAFKAPGRELLIALGMFSRRHEAARTVAGSEPQLSWRSWLRAELCTAARSAPTDVKRLQLLTAAVEVDSVDRESDHSEALEELVTAWAEANSWDEASRDAKMIAVARVGDAARRLTEDKHGSDDVVRFRVRKLIDEVTKKAPDIAERLKPSLRFAYPGGTPSRNVEEDIELALRQVEQSPAPAADNAVKDAIALLREQVSEAVNFYLQLYRICCKEDNYQIRLAGAQEIGNGGQTAFAELENSFPQKDISAWLADVDEVQTDSEDRYSATVQAWLLPMLIGSADKADAAAGHLKEWLRHVGNDMPLFLEAALAQGFKYAANRRPQHPYEMANARSHLAARAEQMFHSAEYWYSRLTLLHALGLWALSGTLPPSRDPTERRDPQAVVKRWTRRDDGKPQHPFVLEAGKLVAKALQSEHPERFLWIDESSIATTIGSRSKRERTHAMQTLWIPPSAGWLVLDRRAQQLVADVLILLTLAERGDTAEDWAHNLDRINRNELPLCLSEERREHLQPTQTAGVTQHSPGEKCKSGCLVGLCPYPPKGQHPYRVELSEAFCRKQRELLPRFARRAAWQHATRPELRRFWRTMEERART